MGFHRYKFCALFITGLIPFFGNSQLLIAPAKGNKGWGYIRQDMTWLVPPTYDRFWEDRQYIVAENNSESVLWEFHDGMAGIRISERWGFVDTSGTEVIKHQFIAIRDFRESLAAVLKKGKWGYIDKTGNYVIPPQFEEARSFYFGLAAVCIDKKWGLIDKTGIFVIPAEYSEIKNNTPLLIAARKKKWGFIDHSNNWILEPIYNDAFNFTEGFARVEKNGAWWYIDTHGKYISEQGFDKAMPFIDHFARVKKEGFWSYLNTTGKVLGGLKFFNAEDFSEDYARVNVKEGWGYINRQGTWVISPKYSYAGNFKDGIGRVKVLHTTNLSDPGEWIFIDKDGKRLYPTKNFEKAEDFYLGKARVKSNGKWGYIDTSGEFFIKPQYENCLDFDSAAKN